MSKKEDFDYQYKSKINIIFIKVILIGDAKVGKTSFIVRFLKKNNLILKDIQKESFQKTQVRP